jgi:sugar O-acyltransferase (sialic acid O-acetyltransferase NeuD family)
MKRLLIVGAGGFGREVLCWARDAEKRQSEWRVFGFLDANPRALDGFTTGVDISGDPTEYYPSENDCFICALGDPKTKRLVVSGLMERGADFITLVHPSAIVGSDCRIGPGSILCPGVILTTSVTLGNHVILNLGTTIGHDAQVGNWCSLMVHVDVGGEATLGEGVYAGSQAFILPRIRVGDEAVIGAGSVVTRHIQPRATAFGVPARVIGISTEK